MVPVSLVPEVPARFWVKVLDCLCFCLVPGVGACAPCLCLGVGAVCCLPAAGAVRYFVCRMFDKRFCDGNMFVLSVALRFVTVFVMCVRVLMYRFGLKL